MTLLTCLRVLPRSPPPPKLVVSTPLFLPVVRYMLSGILVLSGGSQCSQLLPCCSRCCFFQAHEVESPMRSTAIRLCANFEHESDCVELCICATNGNTNGYRSISVFAKQLIFPVLTSPFRVNVLLSRAQHGMYIVGNAGESVWSGLVRRFHPVKYLAVFPQLLPRLPHRAVVGSNTTYGLRCLFYITALVFVVAAIFFSRRVFVFTSTTSNIGARAEQPGLGIVMHPRPGPERTISIRYCYNACKEFYSVVFRGSS